MSKGDRRSCRQGDIIGYVAIKSWYLLFRACLGHHTHPCQCEGGQKLGDIHPGTNREECFKITPQAKRITACVIEAIERRYP
jgi:hypothetical protein